MDFKIRSAPRIRLHKFTHFRAMGVFLLRTCPIHALRRWNVTEVSTSQLESRRTWRRRSCSRTRRRSSIGILTPRAMRTVQFELVFTPIVFDYVLMQFFLVNSRLSDYNHCYRGTVHGTRVIRNDVPVRTGPPPANLRRMTSPYRAVRTRGQYSKRSKNVREREDGKRDR